MKLNREYPHLLFRQHWTFTREISHLLGECEAYVRVINYSPMLPELYHELLSVSLVKGAQATTAIEGNTLSFKEVQGIAEGAHLPESKAYLEQEVRNILEALNSLRTRLVHLEEQRFIEPDFILELHKMVGKDIGASFDAIPGAWRTDDRIVGAYRCPDHRDIQTLIHQYCDWMKKEFGYRRAKQSFDVVIVQAVVAHVYFEWIHPFGDGNGRTGRLMEFFVLLRGNVPDIASHILSNHYNETRQHYYWQLNNACQKRDLTEFIEYSVRGFRDGLIQTLEKLRSSLWNILWERLIYRKFDAVTGSHRDTIRRQRAIALNLQPSKVYTIHEMININISTARHYAKLSRNTIRRDVESLVQMNIILETDGGYTMNVKLLHSFVVTPLVVSS